MYYAVFNAPPPPTRKRRAIYPLHEMEVGQAFDAPRDMGLTSSNTDRRAHAVSCAIYMFRRRRNPSAHFTTRLIDDQTVRCWRVA